MLIVYEVATGAVLHNTGLRSFPDPPAEQWFSEVLAPRDPERPMADFGFYPVDDIALAKQITDAGSYELRFFDGQPVGVQIYPRVQLSGPTTAAVDMDVELVATVPADSPDTSATFSVEGGASITEDIAAATATTILQFANPGRYAVWVETAHHGSAGMEVIVQ
jgi:hypothetical protein